MQNPANSANPAANGQNTDAPADRAAGQSQQSKVSSEFQNFLADIEDLVKQTTSLTGEDLTRARAQLNSRIDSAKASAEVVGENVVQRALETANATNEYVHQQPWKAVAIGTAVGFVLGSLLTRRN